MCPALNFDFVPGIPCDRSVLSAAGNMETTLYEEQTFNHPMPRDMSQLKLSMTLDLHGPSQKKLKLDTSLCSNQVTLTSPDVNMLKLGTPELVKLIIDQPNDLSTATPTSTPIQFPKNATQEQESYAAGFIQALNKLHHSESSQNGSGVMLKSEDPKSYYGYSMSPIDSSVVKDERIVKDEPQTVPNINCSPAVSPIDMDNQEKIKLERKRLRNRLAASKCRKRKLERISLLEDKVRMLKGENAELAQVANKLKAQVCHLKEQVLQHINHGCHIVFPQ